ncbi:MAG: hypothetical protein JWL82_90 [Parcubacteria group bacterium]|nr:hypothetical protein [Parcubacteria group bacterium]
MLFLGSLYVRRVRAFLALDYLKGDFVSLLKLGKGRTFKGIGVEEEVFLNAWFLDHSTIALVELGDLARVCGTHEENLPF